VCYYFLGSNQFLGSKRTRASRGTATWALKSASRSLDSEASLISNPPIRHFFNVYVYKREKSAMHIAVGVVGAVIVAVSVGVVVYFLVSRHPSPPPPGPSISPPAPGPVPVPVPKPLPVPLPVPDKKLCFNWTPWTAGLNNPFPSAWILKSKYPGGLTPVGAEWPTGSGQWHLGLTGVAGGFTSIDFPKGAKPPPSVMYGIEALAGCSVQQTDDVGSALKFHGIPVCYDGTKFSAFREGRCPGNNSANPNYTNFLVKNPGPPA